MIGIQMAPTARRIVERIRDRGLVLVALHSAHWATPFIEAMNERARDDVRRRFADVPADKLAIREVPAQHYKVPARDGRLPPASDQRRFPDGRMGSHPALSTPEHGKRFLDAVVADLSADYVRFAAA